MYFSNCSLPSLSYKCTLWGGLLLLVTTFQHLWTLVGPWKNTARPYLWRGWFRHHHYRGMWAHFMSLAFYHQLLHYSIRKGKGGMHGRHSNSNTKTNYAPEVWTWAMHPSAFLGGYMSHLSSDASLQHSMHGLVKSLREHSARRSPAGFLILNSGRIPRIYMCLPSP